MDPIVQSQAIQNRSTAGQWPLFASHREQIERLLVPAQAGLGRLCVLGAGNCNDVDLQHLLKLYREIHLVELDRNALAAAAERQQLAGDPRLVLHAPVDLSGVATLAPAFHIQPQPPAAIEHLVSTAARRPTLGIGPFDTVVSPCVLSQLLHPVRAALGTDHPQIRRLCHAVQIRHLQLMLELIAPGGRVVLVVDPVASDKFPDLPRIPREQLPSLLTELIRARKHFPGLEPESIRRLLEEVKAQAPEFTPPWHWHLSLRRSFLVYGVVFKRALR